MPNLMAKDEVHIIGEHDLLSSQVAALLPKRKSSDVLELIRSADSNERDVSPARLHKSKSLLDTAHGRSFDHAFHAVQKSKKGIPLIVS